MIEIDNNKMWEAIKKLLDVADAIKVSLNKQGLQWNGKEIVSTEPKFKVGDWVTFYGGKPFKILKVESEQNGILDYLLLSQNGHDSFYNKKYVDENARLWTIADAKDGDVLSNGKMIVIFKHFEEPSYRQHIVAYIGLDTNGDIQITDDTWNLGIDKAKPATKEQREQLEKAIADAEYVWLSGKKELKKIEELTELENESKSILLDKTINWDEIRIQAAIAAMQGMLANATLVDDARLDYRITIEQAAVSYANTLVEELKKKG